MCTLEKQGNLYILTLIGPDEHRLNPTLISTIRNFISQIKSEVIKSKSPSALITTAQGKFFSNGYDLAWAKSPKTPKSQSKLMVYNFQTLIAEILSLPLPTIAAVTGHASAAGFILAIAHDYVIMRRERGFLYMSEMDIKLKIPKWFVVMVKCKVSDSKARRDVLMAAKKVTAEIGREIGVVDEVVDGERETVEKAVKLGNELVIKDWDGEVYGETRRKLYKEVLDEIEIGFDETVEENSGRTPKEIIRPRL